ncbi:MAG: YebC/PmpR family DNA-binding transcriptional regulator [Veillonellaceae bacterium]|jgi:YebC/PmpR family DNA-binding regulatory protein|nr:YebC/PmpR family DNA-binding transcriptional regulator [Veillonellaceae bacterium]
MAGHSKWANIKHKKGKMDAIRGKITTKISREITVAVRTGGSDPTGNMRLKLALQKAKENNIPKDNIQRAIQKGAGTLEGANYEELTYEGYGPGGVALMVEAMTDNRNRTAAEIRHLFSKYGGNLGETGCVSWMFKKKGIFVIDKETGVDEEELMMLVLDAGAEDLKSEDGQFEITTAPEEFVKVQEALENNNINTVVAQIAMVPDTTMAVGGDDATKLMKLVELLEEHDDVQEVYGNFDLPEDIE